MPGTIFANRTQIEFWNLTEIFEGMIAYDFIKIKCCQKIQKEDLGRVNKQRQALDQAQYCHFPPLFENWRSDLCDEEINQAIALALGFCKF